MNKHMPLTPLRQARKGIEGAIYCLPGAGDGITSFMSLANSLKNELPVFGLQPKGLASDQEPHSSIDSMVNEYVELIYTKATQGPYYLIGHSFGGYIALEIAFKLKKLACDLASLILLDVSVPQKNRTKKSRTESLLTLIQVMELNCKKSFKLSYEALATLSEDEQLQALHKSMVTNNLLPIQSSPESIRGMVRLFIVSHNMDYWPSGGYDGTALYVNALEANIKNEERYNNLESWRRFIPKLKYAESPGNHVTMLGSKNTQTLASIIEREWSLI